MSMQEIASVAGRAASSDAKMARRRAYRIYAAKETIAIVIVAPFPDIANEIEKTVAVDDEGFFLSD